MIYNPPKDEAMFFLITIGEIEEILKATKEKDVDIETINTIIDEFVKFTSENSSLTNKDKSSIELESSKIILDYNLKKIYDQFINYGWNILKSPKEYKGQGLPLVINSICTEFLCASNLSLSLLNIITNCVIETIKLHASEELKNKFLFNLVNGKSSGAISLIESSNIDKITTKAIKNKDHYLISGKKNFIAWGDHELTENIIHLVSARLNDSPEGKNGISLFIVPKFIVNNDGNLGEKNNINIISLEKNLDIKSNPTCCIEYNNAKAYLIGEIDKGIDYISYMINNYRLEIGVQSTAIADISFQYSKYYVNNLNNYLESNQYPDIKRMLLIQKAIIGALRALYIYTFSIYDIYNYEKNLESKVINKNILDFMIPVVKSFCSENSVLITNLTLQIYSEIGYLEEDTNILKFLRNSIITSIDTGTNGTQSIDFVKTKTIINEGLTARYMINDAKLIAKQMKNIDASLSSKLNYYLELINQLIEFILNNRNIKNQEKVLIGSLPYLIAFGTFLGGLLLAKSYIKAKEYIKNKNFEKFNEDFLKNQINITNIYFDYILPNIDSYYKKVKFGFQGILDYDIENINL